MYEMLDNFKDYRDIKILTIAQLNILSSDIREFLIDKVSKTGGHLASNLGVVELTISLYNVFNFERDKLIWDVGHQAYVHKILTGRKGRFDSLRKYGGLSGFPKCDESKFDMFQTGHSSTSLSAAIGMARARDLNKERYNVVAVIGDGALTGGMAFEALNDIGYNKSKIIIVLNDNQMSIAKNVGGMSKYLSDIRVDPKYTKLKHKFNSTLNRSNLGKIITKSVDKIKSGIKQLIVPGMLFEDFGIKYLGPIDGHDIKELSRVFSMAKDIEDPVIIHVITKKGKGYNFAEKNPDKFHGIGPFNCKNGEVCASSGITYSSVFGDEIVKLAEKDEKIVAITAAMRDGTGLLNFSKKFKDRFFDVGIAEEHAVTMAAGMAKAGFKPVFAVYSTFLQRAYDQILHDVCIQNLHVIFAIDRAGIVGEDGETHQGVFDLSYLSHIPNITIMSPKCVEELRIMLNWAVMQTFPIALRYPRGGDNKDVNIAPISKLQKGVWEIVSSGEEVAIIAVGKMVQQAVLVKKELLKLGINPMVVNACFIKPIDKSILKELASKKYKIITIEDNLICGGIGSLILNYINTLNTNTNILNLGFKDEFIPHGTVKLLYKLHSLDIEGITESILKFI